eukprot:gene31637-53972_t
MRSRTLAATGIAVAVIGVAGVAGAGVGITITGGGKGGDRAELSCPGGMSRLAHPWGYGMSIFDGDPVTTVTIVNEIEPDGYLLEQVSTGVHTGTHLDAPGHFIEGGRTVDELQAQEFVWPAYVIDVRSRMTGTEADGFQLTIDDIKAVERSQGKIPKGAMVIIQTGFDEKFGTDEYVLGSTPGFAGDTVQWMVNARRIGGIGSDTLGPDATSDPDFSATFTILDNDRVALPDIDNLD